MKKLFCSLSALAICAGMIPSTYMPISIQAAETKTQTESQNQPNYRIEKITGEKEIREYQESMGQEYDPDVIEVYRRIDTNKEKEAIETRLGNDYFIKNKKEEVKTDKSNIISQFGRPAGTIKVNQTYTTKHSYSATGKVSASILSAELGYKVNGEAKVSVNWSNKYSYPVEITIYPIHKITKGELWEDDVFFDDKLGTFTAKKVIGDDLQVKKK